MDKRVGFSMEGIVAAKTITLWEECIELLRSTGRPRSATRIENMRDSMVKHMPLHNFLVTS